MAHNATTSWLAVALSLAVLATPRAGLAQTTGAFADPYLKDLRRQMIAGAMLSDTEMRSLADAGDGLAAFRYAQRLDEAAVTEGDALLASRIHYYAIAVYTGRDFAVNRLAKLVDQATSLPEKPGPARVRIIEDALLVAARRGSVDAALVLAKLYMNGQLLEPSPKKALKVLGAAAAGEDPKAPRAALELALIAIGPDPAQPLDADTAHQMLVLAAAGSDLSARTTAENLLRILPDRATADAGGTP